VSSAAHPTRYVSLLGLGFGDCGKGRFTDHLCGELQAHTVVRFNGGAQAGHNVVLADGRHHTFSQFGAGTFAGAATWLAQPMIVNVAGSPVSVSNIHTDSTFGGFDLVVRYETDDVSNMAATRTKSVALMKALLTLHPEWKEGFHGMWVFANAPNQQPFSLELSMPQIAAQS